MVTLDSLEFRSPLAEWTTQDGRKIPATVTPTWQRRLKSLWEYVQGNLGAPMLLPVIASRATTLSDRGNILLCSGTITLTIPAASTAGDTYYFFNNGNGVITIAGNVNGNAAGYVLVNKYQYVQVTSSDGVKWIVTANN